MKIIADLCIFFNEANNMTTVLPTKVVPWILD